MSNRELPHSLRAELDWAVNFLRGHGSPSPDSLQMIENAIRAKSPMLPKRFGIFYNNSAPVNWPEDEEPPRHSLHRLGGLLVALDAWGKGEPWRLYQPDEFDGGTARQGRKGAVIQFRCTEAWKLKLRTYCERAGYDLSSLIITAVDTHLADNPLWKTGQAETEE